MKLLLVYNANSGKINALLDAGHKLMSPSTYKCSLCALTYNTFTENRIWKTYRTESAFTMEFYHKDEFEEKFPSVKMSYPTILKLEQNKLTTVLSPADLNQIRNAEGLIDRLKTRV